jgi:hypothetical protein
VKKCPKQILNASYVSSFMVGVPKKNKRHQVFFKLFFINNIYMEKNWIIQIKIIFMLVMIFHICTSLCIKNLFQTHKCKKWSNRNSRTIRFIFHDYFLHMWLTLWVRNSNPRIQTINQMTKSINPFPYKLKEWNLLLSKFSYDL